VRRGVRLAVLTGVVALASAAPAVLAADAVTASAPAADAAPIAKAQIDAARPVVEKLFPVGTYRRMMGENMSRMMDSMMGNLMQMPLADLARIGGVSGEKLAEMSPASLAEVSAIVDPHYRDRAKRGMDAIMGGMTDLMDGFEPRVREALTRAYARKFSAGELAELRDFFATPVGGKYAGQSMSIFMDPEIMGEMQALMPEMMQQMPRLAEEAKKATEALPPPRKIADLSKAERKRLAAILGVKEDDLRDQPEAAGSDEEKNEEGTQQ